MLSTNHNRSNKLTVMGSQEVDQTIESTKYAGSNCKEDNLSEIEKKFKKKKKNWQANMNNKMYKEDDVLDENYLEKNYNNQERNPMLKTKKDDIR